MMIVKKNVEIAVTLKYLSNFYRTLGLIVKLASFEDCIISFVAGAAKFKIIDTKLCVPVVILSSKI